MAGPFSLACSTHWPDPAEFCSFIGLSAEEIAAELEVHPKGSGVPKEPSQAQRIIECFNGIKLIELAPRDGPEALGAGASGGLCRNAVEEVLGSPIREGPNHGYIIARLPCYFKSI